MKKERSLGTVSAVAEKATQAPRQEILWLRDFLFYRIPVAASYMLKETALICAGEKPGGLTIAQWRIISILANQPSLLATEISRISMLDEVAVSRALSLLARRGFIQRKSNRQDKRAREVSLTPAGWRYYGTIMPRMKEQNDIVLGLFSRAELDGLYGALDKIDELFKELNAQRRLYGPRPELKDIAERKVRAIASEPSNVDARRKK